MSGRMAALLLLVVAVTPTSFASGAVPPGSAASPTSPQRMPAGPAERVAAYRPPVPGRLEVLRPFDPPLTPYGPGHLGVDLRAGATVLAAGAGVVRFAGQVAGRGVVVVAHPDGIRTEYEPVRASVRSGETVRAGQVIGVVVGRHRGCAGACLHWGARRGATYLDPLDLLRALGPVRLLPWSRAGP